MLGSSPERADQNLHDHAERDSRAWATFGFAMLVVIGLIAGWTLERVRVSDKWVDHTYDVLAASQQMRTNLGDAKLATHEYLAGGDRTFLARYRKAADDTLSSFAMLRSRIADSATQQQQMDKLQPLLSSELDDLAAMIALRNASEAEINYAASRESGRTDQIRVVIHTIESEEYRLLRQRSSARNTELLRGLLGTIGAALLALVALILGPIQVSRAVKQREAADREKRESESLAHLLFEAAPEAIVIVDQTGAIVLTNPECEKLFGYAPDELHGQQLSTLVPARLRTEHAAHHEGFFESPRFRPTGLNLDIKARRKDGTEFDAEVSLGHFQTDKGTLAVAFVSNISQRRQDERAIRQQREELRQLAGKLMTAQDDERRRIARNLHDDLSQSLAAIAIDLGRLAGKHSVDEIVAGLRPLQKLASDASEHVRQISHELHPSIVDDLGLKVALEELCADFESRSGIATHFTSHEMPDYLAADVSGGVYHIAGECLRNVAKHSKSRCVFMDAGVAGDVVYLKVHDDGVGFTQTRRELRNGIGIATMRERAHLLGGTVSIESENGNGTTVNVEVPVKME